MYKILIVDDEPMICKGLSNLLKNSGLDISQVFTAYNGFEALDYLRMEEVDLLITDIQMDEMNGIELMHQSKVIKPWIQTIVISAHEDFHYAKQAIRLGAKDYLIKPLNSEHLLATVRNTLLKMKKDTFTIESMKVNFREDFVMREPDQQSDELLKNIVETSNDKADISKQLDQLFTTYNIALEGPYFSVIKIKLDLVDSSEKVIKEADLYRYAAFNIVQELLAAETNHSSFYSNSNEITIILQWTEREFSESGSNVISYLEVIGRTIDFYITKYLNIGCLVGISQILNGIEFLADLNKQAEKAISWNFEYQENHVFYYGDFNWSLYDAEPSSKDISEQNNNIVRNVKKYIQENYHQKGLTLNYIAQENYVSPNYLSYLFKKHTSYNLWEYVVKLRMEASKKLILNTDLRRYEIAEQVGYESPEHFGKVFKKYYGKNLSEMKK